MRAAASGPTAPPTKPNSISPQNPADVRREIVEQLVAPWTRWTTDDAARAWGAFMAAYARQSRHAIHIAKLDSAPSRAGITRARRDALAARRDAQRAALATLEEILYAGLRARHGLFLVPPAVVQRAIPEDWRCYVVLAAQYVKLRGTGASAIQLPVGASRRLTVCDSCTAVFSTVRAGTKSCTTCRKRPAAGPLGLRAPSRPGEPIPFRVPRLTAVGPDGTVGNVVDAWQTWHHHVCVCGEQFVAHKHTATRCDRCEQQRPR